MLWGIGFALGQSVFFSMLALMVKLASKDHHTIDVMFWRSFVCFLGIALILKVMGDWSTIYKANMKRQLIRGVVGTIGMLLTFWAFSLLPLSQVQSLLFAAPLFVVALSYPVLGEKVGVYRAAAACVGFVGVLMIVQPSAINSVLGGVVGLGAAFMHATIMLMLRFLGRSEEPLVTVFYFSLISSVLMLPVLPFFWSMPSLMNFTYLVLSGVFALGTQICLTKSYVYAPAAILAPVTYLNLLWAVLFDLFLWDYVPSMPIIVGSAIIITSNFLIVWREARKSRQTCQRGKDH